MAIVPLACPQSNGTAGSEWPVLSQDEPTAEQVAEGLSVFVRPDDVTELRAMDVAADGRKAHTASGFFDGRSLDLMARQALTLSPIASGVYFIFNPLKPELLGRRKNRVASAGKTAADADVVARRWLMVDCDPVRVGVKPGVKASATDGEKAEARRVARLVEAGLRGEGWPDPVVADSGNGYHLMYPSAGLGLATADVDLARRVLHGIAARFDTDTVKIDRVVFNAARIVKLYGTVARKGENTPERPHRRSGILVVPAHARKAVPLG